MFVSSFETLQMIFALEVFLFTINRPIFCQGFFGWWALATTSVSSPILRAAFCSSSCLGAGTAMFLGVFLPCFRVFVESKYVGHRMILFCFLMLAQLGQVSLGISIAFTSPFCPGRDVTLAVPIGVSIIVPLVITPLRL